MSVRLLPHGPSRIQQRSLLNDEMIVRAQKVIDLTAACAWPAPTVEAVEQRQRREHELRVAQTEMASTCDRLARLQREKSRTRLELIALAMTLRRDAQRSLAALVVNRIAGAR